MRYAQFYHSSTGYIAGTIPPRYSPDHVKPIPACGSDGVAVLNQPWPRCLDEAREHANRLKSVKSFTGFEIWEGKSFTESRLVRGMEKLGNRNP